MDESNKPKYKSGQISCLIESRGPPTLNKIQIGQVKAVYLTKFIKTVDCP